MIIRVVHCVAEALGGFQLSYNDYDYDNDYTNLSARFCLTISDADLTNTVKNHE